ncbi:hypothetical protein Micbo1qcDRAFT_220165 [Microdochium bolleyi]|uniref:Uncharacterized protein n=1 Tax=Microdochium bolleyi TaxID=196109 RepID=A0A136ILM5_9PEZI|nr:hypothetical protein Micbo1qcDRAFT_220165 [Microdochium bolleyi]
MIASIVLEWHGVPLEAVVPISLARYSNNGPQSLARFSLTPTVAGWFWSSIIMILFFILMASQFTSTLLVRDLRPLSIVDFAKTVPNRYTVVGHRDRAIKDTNIAIFGGAFDYLYRRPTTFGIFADFSKPSDTSDDIDDTGVSVRALLPIASQIEREHVRKFQGVARVIDSRVVCSGLNATSIDTDFKCDIVAGYGLPDQFQWALCRVSMSFTLLSVLTNATAYGDWHPSAQYQNRAWLVLNIGHMYTQLPQTNLTNGTWATLESKGDGAWLKQRLQWTSAKKNSTLQPTTLDFQASWCAEVGPEAPVAHLNITASSPSQTTMREPTYSTNATSNTFDTEALRQQVGAAPRVSNLGPQVLTITEEDMEKSLSAVRGVQLSSDALSADFHGDPNFGDTMGWLGARASISGRVRQINLSPDVLTEASRTVSQEVRAVDGLLCSIFGDTIRETNSPARALQAFRTVQYRTIYYDLIGSFTADPENPRTALIESFTTVLAPTSWTGFAAVVAVIAAHLGVFFTVLVLYCRWSRWSLLDNGWSAVAQIVANEDAQVLLSGCSGMPDGRVKDWIHSGAHRAASIRYELEDGIVVRKRDRSG